MQLLGSQILLSATDLVNFHECAHLSALDLRALDDKALRAQRTQPDEHAELLFKRGNEFEASYLADLKLDVQRTGGTVVKIEKRPGNPAKSAAATLDALHSGADLIYQATFLDGNLVGHADFLRKVPRPSALGDFSYEVIDTKLGRHAKASYVLQLAFYGDLLARVQQLDPHAMHVVLGTREQVTFTCSEYSRYFRRLLGRFTQTIANASTEITTRPTPCSKCPQCHWNDRCTQQRADEDSLHQVAGIRSSQVHKLEVAGVRTLEALANLSPTAAVPHLAEPSLTRLREQAAMQLRGRETGELHNTLVEHPDGEPRGFALLPPPDEGDVYFDMEGDPLYGDDGLEYLFGVYYREKGTFKFKGFWAHSPAEEKAAFEQLMDWLDQRTAQYPSLHVYHYASYEETALKKLSGRHSTREALLDTCLRERRLVDLYKVVREAIRASTPSYSIKDIEKFYRGARQGDAQTADASTVYYERYLETGDQAPLEKIERYNEDDVESTQQLHQWLIKLRAKDLRWRGGENVEAGSPPPPPGTVLPRAGLPSAKLQGYLDRVDAVRRALSVSEAPAREVVADLLEFHRRSEKPQWWEMFARTELTFDDLLESVDAIAGLVRVPGTMVDEYEYPAQEIKFDAGDKTVWLEHPTGLKVTLVEIDEDRRRVRLSLARKHGPLPDRLSLGKDGPLTAEVIKQALLRVGQSVADGDHRYRAVEAYLEKQIPRLTGRKPGEPIVSDPSAPLAQTIDAVRRLDGSYLFIQGPPGAGKTYTGSHVIAALLADGKRVAVSSNSHKAINNLLEAVEEVLIENGQKHVRAGKRSTARDAGSYLNGQLIVDVDETPAALHPDWQLMGGTAWLFADPAADQQYDYLFVDEAGQVSVANLAAIGACAKNIVLLGDQMQLGQPIQGTHPGRSGESTLEYLLDGLATVPPDRGIFLPTTWRMCPDVCRFISDAVYDGRLEPERKNANQTLVLGTKPHPALQPTGVVFWPMDHAGCGQKSTEEAQEIERFYQSLLKQASWIDREGVKRRITPDDILVVAHYNLQVKLLQRTLPANARVGTVDKFQGQEAAVSIVSMTTSSEEDLPRHLEFLFSKNRLNVAISRARCQSIVVANPRLLDVRCKTPGEIALVNTLCWAGEATTAPCGRVV